VMCIEREFVADIHEDEERRREADGKSERIDDRVTSLFAKVTKGEEHVVE
jgi:hypothetical protein